MCPDRTRREPPPADAPLECIGVGFGPSNIALAIALERRGLLDRCLFLEQGVAPDWHGDLLVPGGEIAHPPLRDLVSPHDPQSRYGFLPYLRAQGRLTRFLDDPAAPVPRVEYARYVRWAARQFDRVTRYASRVVTIDASRGGLDPVFTVVTQSGAHHRARSISFATGQNFPVPGGLSALTATQCVNAGSYLTAAARWAHEGAPNRICMIGSAEIGADILCDLADRFPRSKLDWVCPGARPVQPRLEARLHEWSVMGDGRVTCHAGAALQQAVPGATELAARFETAGGAPFDLEFDAALSVCAHGDPGTPPTCPPPTLLAGLPEASLERVFVAPAATFPQIPDRAERIARRIAALPRPGGATAGRAPAPERAPTFQS